MSIHKSRRTSMTWSYVWFAATLVAVLMALAFVAAGYFTIDFEAWRFVYVVGPLVAALVTIRLVRAR